VLAAVRAGTRIMIPSGDTVMGRDWRFYVVGRTDAIDGLLKFAGVESRPIRKVLIAGGGQVGARLGELLLEAKVQVTIVQRSRERALDLASQLSGAQVLHGDTTDPEILREAGVEEADYFVAATQDDMTNMMSSLLAREMGAHAVIALYNRQEFLNVMRAAQIDLPISPRLITAGTILRSVHGREILSLDLVAGGEGEVVEFQVPHRAKVLSKPLKDLRFPKGCVVAAVVRGEEIFVPSGDFSFAEGDRVVIFTLAEQLPKLEKIFHGR
jgi:trk system potassium uptake protein TrkA